MWVWLWAAGRARPNKAGFTAPLNLVNLLQTHTHKKGTGHSFCPLSLCCVVYVGSPLDLIPRLRFTCNSFTASTLDRKDRTFPFCCLTSFQVAPSWLMYFWRNDVCCLFYANSPASSLLSGALLMGQFTLSVRQWATIKPSKNWDWETIKYSNSHLAAGLGRISVLIGPLTKV